MYDPSTGRFNRLDPFAGNVHDPQSLHKYAYVHGDPVTNIDPTGQVSVPAVHSLLTRLTIGADPLVKGVGHHWIPQSVYNALFEIKLISDEALAVFEKGTRATLNYSHGYDTWNGVTHARYNEAIDAVLRKFVDVSSGSPIDGDDAKKLLIWIRTGMEFDNKSGLSATTMGLIRNDDTIIDLIRDAQKWRKGFMRSVTIAHTAKRIAKERGINITKEQLKLIAKRRVNQDTSVKLAGNARKLSNAIDDLARTNPRRWAGLLGSAARNILPAIGAWYALSNFRRGNAGQGFAPGGGFLAGINEVGRGQFMGELLIEPGLKFAGQGVHDWLFDPETPPEERLQRRNPWLEDVLRDAMGN
ncbi:hypothetical protein CA54_14790 [Symmachiella macrocystis]|uniref:tRNA(Glu)-specific nuclease WapA n=1 Tax=Symmachiella macrocystis TaxID=2527985 RepID=A0A5C6BKZ9_9PLAN|nr:RHS repeat-associated core domain-containing protein [Symmachiella macrocystis]TWU12655.1 hypothetical protein CA54_14790 [Symmachiella macrocystis]